MDQELDTARALAGEADLAALRRIDLETTLVARAWYDEVFRLRLLTDPKGTIEREAGVRLPADLRVAVHQETPSQRHIVIPLAPDFED